ncbi:MAG: hypothetical protein M0R75_08305 [Dehalococcoidia bacterium]|nr:hypothetical protein [Dehalococcoidia bacterium]
MPRPTIFQTMDEAVADVADGSSIMIPGFGPGVPINLLAALWRQGATDLTTISNGVGAHRSRPGRCWSPRQELARRRSRSHRRR